MSEDAPSAAPSAARAAARTDPRAAGAPATARPRLVLVGIGNELRGDDGVGLELARRVARRADPRVLAVREHAGETLGLIEELAPFGAAVLIDALRSGGVPGSSQRLDLSRDAVPRELRRSTSTHAIGVGEAVELARALELLPARVVLYAVEGERFDAGSPLSDAVHAALPGLTEALLRELRTLALAP